MNQDRGTTASSSVTSFRACNICEAICGLEIEVESGVVGSIRGDANDPLSKGHICPKGVALADIHRDGDRLRRPMRKGADGEWQEVTWKVAFDEIASRLHTIQDEHGERASAMYLGNPTVHNQGTLLFSELLRQALGRPQMYSATSLDQLPHHYAAREMFGHSMLLPVPDIDRTDMMLIIGANPVASNGSLMTAPGVRERLKQIQSRGGRVVVMDPRRTETGKLADVHHRVLPGSDVWVLCVLVRLVIEGTQDAQPHRALELSDGVDELKAAVSAVTTASAAHRSGLSVEAIEDLAASLMAAKSAVVYGRMGASTQAHGGLCQWLINCINILSGNFDEPGGAMFPNPALPIVRGGKAGTAAPVVRSRVRGLPAFDGHFPVATLADEILTAGDGQIRALFTLAGNPVLSGPNGQKMDAALASLDLCVALDIYLNETTRHADYILPPTTGLEIEHYDLVFHALSVRNTARYSLATVPAPEGALADWQILGQLSKRLLRFSPRPCWIKRAVKARAMRWLTPRGLVDLGLKLGPFGAWSSPRRWRTGLTLKRLLQHPHGIDLGPLEQRLPGCLRSRTGRIELTPPPLISRLEEIIRSAPEETPNDSRLALIGRRHLLSNNSWLHNVDRLARGKSRCTLMIHPDDAQTRGLSSGDRVAVSSSVGQVETIADVTEDCMPGVVSLPHGYGHSRGRTKTRVASERPGVSINDLTLDTAVDTLTGNAAFSGIRVMVDRVTPEEVDP